MASTLESYLIYLIYLIYHTLEPLYLGLRSPWCMYDVWVDWKPGCFPKMIMSRYFSESCPRGIPLYNLSQFSGRSRQCALHSAHRWGPQMPTEFGQKSLSNFSHFFSIFNIFRSAFPALLILIVPPFGSQSVPSARSCAFRKTMFGNFIFKWAYKNKRKIPNFLRKTKESNFFNENRKYIPTNFEKKQHTTIILLYNTI